MPLPHDSGFQIAGVTTLFAATSTINAKPHPFTKVIYQLAMLGELPRAFGRPIGDARVSLVISSPRIIPLVIFSI